MSKSYSAELRLLGLNLQNNHDKISSFQLCTNTQTQLYQKLLLEHRQLSDKHKQLQAELKSKGVLFVFADIPIIPIQEILPWLNLAIFFF